MANIKLKNGQGQEVVYNDINEIKVPHATEASQVSFVSASGTKNITTTALTDVKSYENAQVVDSNLTAANIAKNKTILGVTGTYTSDATATAAGILSGQTAYVNGSKLTGTISTVTPSSSTSSVGSSAGSITPSTSNRYVNVPKGYHSANRFFQVNGDSNLVAGNIKNGTTIFGVLGTYSGGSTEALPTPTNFTINPIQSSWNNPFPTQIFTVNYGETSTPETVSIESVSYKDEHSNSVTGTEETPSTDTALYTNVFAKLTSTSNNKYFKNLSTSWQSASSRYKINSFNTSNIWGSYKHTGQSELETYFEYYALPLAGTAGKTSMTITTTKPGYTNGTATFNYNCFKINQAYIMQNGGSASSASRLTCYFFTPEHKYGIYNNGSEDQSYYESYGFKKIDVVNNSSSNLSVSHDSYYWFNSTPTMEGSSGWYFSSESKPQIQYTIDASETAVIKYCKANNSMYYSGSQDSLYFTMPSNVSWYIDGELSTTSRYFYYTTSSTYYGKMASMTVSADGTRVDIVLEKTGSGEYTTSFSTTGESMMSSYSLTISGSNYSQTPTKSWTKTYNKGDSDTIYFDKGDTLNFMCDSSECCYYVNMERVYSSMGIYTLDCNAYKPTAISYNCNNPIPEVYITAETFPIGEGSQSKVINYTDVSSMYGDMSFYCSNWTTSSQSTTLSGSGSITVKYDIGDTITISGMCFETVSINSTLTSASSYEWNTDSTAIFNVSTISLNGVDRTLVITGSWNDIGTGSNSATLNVSGLYTSEYSPSENETFSVAGYDIPSGYSGNLKFNVGDEIMFSKYGGMMTQFTTTIDGVAQEPSSSSYYLRTSQYKPGNIVFRGTGPSSSVGEINTLAITTTS